MTVVTKKMLLLKYIKMFLLKYIKFIKFYFYSSWNGVGRIVKKGMVPLKILIVTIFGHMYFDIFDKIFSNAFKLNYYLSVSFELNCSRDQKC